MHVILYHRDPDGLASAAVVYGHLTQCGVTPDEIETHSIQYGEDLPPLNPDLDSVYMVDFSLQPGESMVELAREFGRNFTWIDHHATSVTAQEEHPALKDVPGARQVNFGTTDMPISAIAASSPRSTTPM